MNSKAEEFREQARDAGDQAATTNNPELAQKQSDRQKGLEQLADNEDWLDGKRHP